VRGKRHALGAAALLCVAASANAGLFDDDEARRRIELLKQELSQQGRDNEARIARLEEQIRNIGVVELVRQLEQTNAEIARLRGQLEVLVNENQQLQKRQRDFYLDLDSRLKRVEGAPASGSGTSPPAAAPTTDATPATSPPRALTREEQQRELKDYDVASNLFRRNDFAAAIEEFRKFLRTYPNSQLAANAQYWIGISYANLKDHRSALAAQEQVLVKHPQSPKAPDAMLAIAALHAEQGDIGSARNTLEDIIARFPASDAAGKARTRLASLRSR
jgi:tol-pal system protein YbgF